MIRCTAAYVAHDRTLHYSEREVIEVNTKIMEAKLDKLVKHELKLFPDLHAHVMNMLINNRRVLSRLLGLEDIEPTPCKM